MTKDEWSASAADWQKMNLEEEVSQLGQEIDGHSQHEFEKSVIAGSTTTRFPLVATTQEQQVFHIVCNIKINLFKTQNASSKNTATYNVDSNEFVAIVPTGTKYLRFDFDELESDTTIICNVNNAGIKDYDRYLLDKQYADKPTVENHTLKIGGVATSIKDVAVNNNRLYIGGMATDLAQQAVNVNNLLIHPEPYTTRALARKAVPSAIRFSGMNICYLVETDSDTHESEWYKEIYNGTDFSDNKWDNDFNWTPDLVSDAEPNSPSLNMFGIKIGMDKYRIRDGFADSEIFDTILISREGRLQNYMIDISGSIVAASSFQVWYYPVVAGKKYRVKLYVDSTHASSASYFSSAPVSDSSGNLIAYKNPANGEMAKYADYIPESDGYVGISVYGTIWNNIGFYELVSIISNEISERKLLDNEAFRNYTKASISSVSGNFEFVDDVIIASSTNGSKLYYTAVQKGQILRLVVAAHDSKSLCKYAFSADIPAENVAISGVTDLSTINAVEKIIICPIDGYIVLNLWFNRSKWVYGIEFGSNDYFLRAEYLHKLSSLRRTFNNNSSAYKTLLLLVGSDPHAELDTFTRFMAFGSRYAEYLDDIVVNGDVVGAMFGAAGNDMPFDSVAGFEDVLLSIGNHDCYNWNNLAPAGHEYDSQYEANNEQKYNRYMKNIANWGVVQPVGVNDESSPYYKACYYYKDYNTDGSMIYNGQTLIAGKVRLVVLDSMDRGEEQTTWLESVLEDAKTNGCHVICMEHIINNIDNATIPDMSSGWSEDYIIAPQSRSHKSHLEAVQSFIDDGGIFICWIHGHTHVYQIGTFESYPKQMYINLGATFRNPNYGHREAERLDNDASFNNFTVFSIDSLRKNIRLLKVGCEFDRDLKHRGTMLISYGGLSPEIIYEF